MKIVIDIPESIYESCKEECEESDALIIDNYTYAIGTGIPLPKGHGRIMDVDKIIKKMEEREEYLKDNRSMYETACVETALDMFGETIIEADKAESEDKA
jgi:hypothetical protein